MKPTIELLHRHVVGGGLTLESLAREMSPENPGKTWRKLQRGFDEDSLTPILTKMLRRRLGVSPAEWRRAEAEEHRMQQSEIVAWQRQKFSPHIWIETISGWRASPLFAEPFLRKINVPSRWHELTADLEIMEVAGAFIAGVGGPSALRLPEDKVSHYLYRHSFFVAYRFERNGAFTEKIEGETIAPIFAFHLR